MNKFLVCFLAIGLVFSVSSQALHVNAQGIEYEEIVENDDLIETEMAAAGVAIFLGGVLVGYLVDGVIQYTTGHSAADWVEYGLEHVEDWILGQSYPDGYYITVTEQGNITVCNPQNYCQIQAAKLNLSK